MDVVEIYESIQGECVNAGRMTTFVRLAGCNLRCSWCDTKYAYDGTKMSDKTKMSVAQVMDKIREFNNNLVEITGGEPLLQREEVKELCYKLMKENFEVDIETNGSIPFDKGDFGMARMIMDIKCPSSGMQDKMIFANLRRLQSTFVQDCVKFVVNDEKDLEYVKGICERHVCNAKKYISPCWGTDISKIVEWMKQNKHLDLILSIQLHKVIWPVNKRGV